MGESGACMSAPVCPSRVAAAAAASCVMWLSMRARSPLADGWGLIAFHIVYSELRSQRCAPACFVVYARANASIVFAAAWSQHYSTFITDGRRRHVFAFGFVNTLVLIFHRSRRINFNNLHAHTHTQRASAHRVHLQIVITCSA